jgi:hypothetical protein
MIPAGPDLARVNASRSGARTGFRDRFPVPEKQVPSGPACGKTSVRTQDNSSGKGYNYREGWRFVRVHA